MPLEEFIITVFCWVETALVEVTAGVQLRTRGFAPRLSDGEVITLEIGWGDVGPRRRRGDLDLVQVQAAWADVVSLLGGSQHLRAASGAFMAGQAVAP